MSDENNTEGDSEETHGPLVEELLELDGVANVRVKKKVIVTHQKKSTGERDDSFQIVREPVISASQFESIADKYGWRHVGVIDAMHDFYNEDKLTKSETIEAIDNE